MGERKLFSRKDGTTFFEDLKDIFENASDDIRYFFQRLFGQLRNWHELAGEPIVNILEGIKNLISNDTFTGELIEGIVERSPNKVDDAILAWLRGNLASVIQVWLQIPDEIDDVEDALDNLLDELGLHTGAQLEAVLDDFGAALAARYSEDVSKDSGAEPLTVNDAKHLIRFTRDLV